MVPIVITQTATGTTDWLVVDYRQAPFNANVTIEISGTATASTLTTVDDPQALIAPVSITRSGTTATMTTSDKHGLTTSDYIRVGGAGAPLDGLYKVASVSSDTVITYTVANSGVTTASWKAVYTPFRTQPITALTNVTATTAASLAVPFRAILTSVTAYTSGTVITNIVQSMHH